MKPIYFPTTYVSPSAAAAMRALFPSVVTCQPFAGRLPPDMRTLQESGFLDVFTPVAGGEQRLDDMVREFRQWGRLHAGGAGLHAAFWRQRLQADSLAEDGSSSQLVSQIKSRLTPARGPTEPDRLMPARVFLHLAQEFDRQRCEVQQDMARHANAERGAPARPHGGARPGRGRTKPGPGLRAGRPRRPPVGEPAGGLGAAVSMPTLPEPRLCHFQRRCGRPCDRLRSAGVAPFACGAGRRLPAPRLPSATRRRTM